MDVGAAELLGAHDLAGRRLHERRAGEEDRALLANDDRLVRHRRHVRAARRARAHDDGDLRDAFRRHRRLVVEDAAEVVAVREDVGLVRQVRAARIDEIDARQPVLARDLLRAQVLLHRHRVVGAALDRRVVADDHAFAAGHAADAGDDAGRRDVVVVHAERGELRELEERAARVEQRADALARQQLAARARASRARRRRRPPRLVRPWREGRRPAPASRRGSSRTRDRADRASIRDVAMWRPAASCARARQPRGKQHEQRADGAVKHPRKAGACAGLAAPPAPRARRPAG